MRSYLTGGDHAVDVADTYGSTLPLPSPRKDTINSFVPAQNIDWHSNNVLTSLSRSTRQPLQWIHFANVPTESSDAGQLRLAAITASIAIANDKKPRDYDSLGVLTKVIYVDSAHTA